MPSAEPAAPPAPAQVPARTRERLDAAVKADDGFFTTFFVSPYSKYIARWAAERGWSANAVTTLSLAVGVAAAAAFATGDRWAMVAGAVALQAAFTLDCVDGQLARYTGTFSAFGAWLDSIFDRAKEYVVFAGLAIGAARTGDDVWLLAGAALALQTLRHALDFSLPGARAAAAGESAPRSLGARGLRWAKKVAGFPIGERFAAISLTAALWGARTTFAVLLGWGGLATAYAVAGRIRRQGVGAVPEATLRAYRDDGPLGRRLGPDGARWAWAAPALRRLAEYGGVLAIAALAGPDAVPAAFALLCAIAFREYDIVSRLAHAGTLPPRRLGAGGWEVRLAVAGALAAIGAVPAGWYAAAALLAVASVAESVRFWRRPARDEETAP